MDEYSTDYSFPTNKACIDKIELSLGSWSISGHTIYLFHFYEYLGDRAIHQQLNYPRAFVHQQITAHSYSSSYSLKALSTNLKRPVPQGYPLFGGKLYARGSYDVELSTEESDYSMNFKLALNLNLTRFIRYQQLVRSQNELGRTLYHLPNPCNAFRSSTPLNHPRTREIALDRSHNFLPRPDMYADEWDIGMRRYIEAMQNYMNDELDNYRTTVPSIDLETAYTPEYQLDYLEVYWDLYSDAPLTRVPEIADHLREHFNNTSETIYPIRMPIPITTSIEQSSQTIRAELQSGLTLRIYAKTNKRVRVEVSINYRKCQQLRINNSTGRTVRDLDSLIDGISRSVTYVQERVNDLWSSIRRLEAEREESDPSPSVSTMSFIIAFYEAFSDTRRAGQLLQQLIANRGIPRRGLSRRDVGSLNKLVRRQMITYRPRPYSRYSIAPSYSSVYDLR